MWGRDKKKKIENGWAAHQSSRLAKNSREGVNEFHDRAKGVDELSILVPIVFERFQVLFQ